MNDTDYMKVASGRAKLEAQTEPNPIGAACIYNFPRVFIVSNEPKPSVNGQGFRLLRTAGKK